MIRYVIGLFAIALIATILLTPLGGIQCNGRIPDWVEEVDYPGSGCAAMPATWEYLFHIGAGTKCIGECLEPTQ